ncbi:MAG: CoA pyrophosphatase [Sphingomonadales bacterium CG12_big_fil_rev_8_21_14_0_65_65_10]|uniref:Coenzyme A pyrophosphatase n=1 Tax=Blastomonas marina TaxID=1867408 RepID=A0ABQ1FEC8_9SPHN|nr:CoA pyrophosphatase [Blastomonas marina]PIW55322.1 MAG: CoA pyrophosphatase [Sphingomonadales bacterium CG12_big_fil_rev_8_21_14_0_65_65_10]WPZ05223.1 CoA pyrophosphatase [Blastomonas marina]GGA06792.1 coenzyme A pyrophosphatase [Blastomonas marina]
MSQLFARLQRLFDEGHGVELPDLLNDQRFADPDPRPAAVLIPVVERPDSEGGPTAILTKRLDDMRKHPGQVAFPGGRIDPGEDAVEAALREAHEELALEPAHVRVVGATDRYVTGTGFEITPVLGVVPPGLPLKPNPGEVEAWFETPLSVLLDRANWSRNTVFWKGADRTYYEMEWDGFHIWGVTAAIIVNLSRRLAWVES